MQGPVIDILLLLLLIVFFGLQQRSRPQLYFRFWFVGWLLVLGSFVVWEVSPSYGVDYRIENAIRYDLLVLGGLAFSMSFLATAGKLRQRFLRAAMVAVPACVAIDLQTLEVMPSWALRPVLVLLVLVGHGCALATIRRDLPRALSERRTVIVVLFGGVGVYMALRALLQPQEQVETWVLTEIMLFVALLYAYSQEKVTVAGVAGTLGFTAWALFYHVADALYTHPVALQNFYQFWNLPKYCVGLSMILRVFEGAAEEYSKLYEDFRTIYETHPHPMFIYDAETKFFLSANAAATESYGYSREEFQQMRYPDLELELNEEQAALDKTVPVPVDGRRGRHSRKDSSSMWVNLYEHEIIFQGKPAINLMARDVTSSLDYDCQLLHQAHHDELTGLATRRLLEDHMEGELARSVEESKKMAVLAIDIDHFKWINDTYGHAVGDNCLTVVAARLKSRMRQDDMIARIGGEEFMAVVGGLQSNSVALKVAQQLLEAFQERVRLGDCDLQVTVSIGIAIYPDHATDAIELRRLADEAMYQAKRDGRDCVRMASRA